MKEETEEEILGDNDDETATTGYAEARETVKKWRAMLFSHDKKKLHGIKCQLTSQ